MTVSAHKYSENSSFSKLSLLLCALLAVLFASCATQRGVSEDARGGKGVASYKPIGRDGSAQRRHYIATFAHAARRNRELYGIPAAITLGQGILESAGGTSYLAVNGNNHFGIKASGDWTGRTICKPGESVRYRRYGSVEQCFADHAKFLRRKRYEPLFRLKITDYKGWARKLKECGYATDPAYATKLIKVIENYNLQQFDR